MVPYRGCGVERPQLYASGRRDHGVVLGGCRVWVTTCFLVASCVWLQSVGVVCRLLGVLRLGPSLTGSHSSTLLYLGGVAFGVVHLWVPWPWCHHASRPWWRIVAGEYVPPVAWPLSYMRCCLTDSPAPDHYISPPVKERRQALGLIMSAQVICRLLL